MESEKGDEPSGSSIADHCLGQTFVSLLLVLLTYSSLGGLFFTIRDRIETEFAIATEAELEDKDNTDQDIFLATLVLGALVVILLLTTTVVRCFGMNIFHYKNITYYLIDIYIIMYKNIIILLFRQKDIKCRDEVASQDVQNVLASLEKRASNS